MISYLFKIIIGFFYIIYDIDFYFGVDNEIRTHKRKIFSHAPQTCAYTIPPYLPNNIHKIKISFYE